MLPHLHAVKTCIAKRMTAGKLPVETANRRRLHIIAAEHHSVHTANTGRLPSKRCAIRRSRRLNQAVTKLWKCGQMARFGPTPCFGMRGLFKPYDVIARNEDSVRGWSLISVRA
jgi:hypothetical protein